MIELSFGRQTSAGLAHHVLAHLRVSAHGATWLMGLNNGWTVQKWLNGPIVLGESERLNMQNTSHLKRYSFVLLSKNYTYYGTTCRRRDLFPNYFDVFV